MDISVCCCCPSEEDSIENELVESSVKANRGGLSTGLTVSVSPSPSLLFLRLDEEEVNVE